jgi:hypothetical protein
MFPRGSTYLQRQYRCPLFVRSFDVRLRITREHSSSRMRPPTISPRALRTRTRSRSVIDKRTGFASSKMAKREVSPADRGLRRCKPLNALRYKVRWRYGCPEAKVIMEIPV